MNIDNMKTLMDLAAQYCVARDKHERACKFAHDMVPTTEKFYASLYEDFTNPPGPDNGVIAAYSAFDEAVSSVYRAAGVELMKVEEAIRDEWRGGGAVDENGVWMGGPEDFMETAWAAYCRRINTWHVRHGSMQHLNNEEQE